MVLDDLETHCSAAEAARELGITEQRVKYLCNHGLLEGYKRQLDGFEMTVWRVSREDVQRYKDKRANRGGYKGSGLHRPSRQWVLDIPWDKLAKYQELAAADGISMYPRYEHKPEEHQRLRRSTKQREAIAAKSKRAGDE